MENAAKALIIAGGILFAIMILSLVVYMSTTTTRMAEAQDEKKKVEELTAFNKEYEAYNKTRMYGADIITVVNKAIDYNRSLDASQQNEAMIISINITDRFIATSQQVTYYASGKTDKDSLIEVGDFSLLAKNGSKTIKIDYNVRAETSEVVKFFQKQATEDTIETIEEKSDHIKKVIKYSALTNFKRAIFTCKECKDNNGDGRIDYMEFEQYKTLKEIDKN